MTLSGPDGWEGDYDLSDTQYRILVEIPGFSLTKPIEIGILENPVAQTWNKFFDKRLLFGFRIYEKIIIQKNMEIHLKPYP